MTVSITIHFEYNDNGTWRDITDVDSMVDQNNITCYYVAEGGNLKHVKTQRGTDAGEFRRKA